MRFTKQNNSGAILLHDLDKISKIIGLAIVNGNEKVNGNYGYNGSNVGKFLIIMN